MGVQRTGPRGAAFSYSSPNIEKLLADFLPQSARGGGFGTSVSRNEFQQKVEKHISDYRSGNGNLSSDVGGEISAKAEALVGQLDPKTSKNFTAYSTGLRYDQRARYLNNLSDTFSRLKSIIA